MISVKTRIRIAPDGSFSGFGAGLPPGEHDAEIVLQRSQPPGDRSDVAALLRRVRSIQVEIAELPVLDGRSPEAILGYNERGHFDPW